MSLDSCRQTCMNNRVAAEQPIIAAYTSGQIPYNLYIDAMNNIYDVYQRCIEQCNAVYGGSGGYEPPTNGGSGGAVGYSYSRGHSWLQFVPLFGKALFRLRNRLIRKEVHDKLHPLV